jgi:hypothetical protein
MEQYDRVQRWFERIEKYHKGTKEAVDVPKVKDNYLAFFQNCYHLRDHIENDSNNSVSESDLDSFIQTTACMSLCADICNGSKHLKLNSKGWSKENPEMADGAIVRDNVSTGVVSVSYKVETDTGEKDAYDLAEECIKEWKKFMKTHNLI